jgi:hypothetical protein
MKDKNMKLCHQLQDLSVKLEQTGKDKFTVTYGKQIKHGLNYSQAAVEYGCVIMHALACDGKLDNRERGEQ